ncbi:MAG: ATP-binding protein [Bacteriovoracaceae bacterium]
MPTEKLIYPWFFFTRIVRLSLLVFLPTLFIILFQYRQSYKDGLLSYLTYVTEENLNTIKKNIEGKKSNWDEWCQGLSENTNIRFSLIENEVIKCDSIKERIGGPAHITFSANIDSEINKDILSTTLKVGPQLYLRESIVLKPYQTQISKFDKNLFYKIVPIAILSYLFFLFLFYRATRPLGSIISKIKKLKVDFPFDKTLHLLYQKDEWAQIEAAINKTNQKLQDQVNQTKIENKKNAAILESIYDDIISIDIYETILFYNNNFKNNFIQEKARNEITPKIWHLFEDEIVLSAFRKVLKAGDKVSLKGLNFKTSNHPDRYFDLTITALRDSEGKITGALGVFYDVTEFKRTEQMRVDFVANVSHEIRTPLTSIKGYCQILESQQNKIDPSLRDFLGKIISNTERMISLFNDLLNLSVIESQNLLKVEELDLHNLIETVTQNITTNYSLKNIQIEEDIKLSFIHGDARLMEQVLSNLVDNACKYSGDSPAVKISSFSKDDRAYIVVADNGPGISKEHLQRIFERFYRVDASREASRGTGLGLSIVKHIIAKHGGRIWAESQENAGTTFIIELPLK